MEAAAIWNMASILNRKLDFMHFDLEWMPCFIRFRYRMDKRNEYIYIYIYICIHDWVSICFSLSLYIGWEDGWAGGWDGGWEDVRLGGWVVWCEGGWVGRMVGWVCGWVGSDQGPLRWILVSLWQCMCFCHRNRICYRCLVETCRDPDARLLLVTQFTPAKRTSSWFSGLVLCGPRRHFSSCLHSLRLGSN